MYTRFLLERGTLTHLGSLTPSHPNLSPDPNPNSNPSLSPNPIPIPYPNLNLTLTLTLTLTQEGVCGDEGGGGGTRQLPESLARQEIRHQMDAKIPS